MKMENLRNRMQKETNTTKPSYYPPSLPIHEIDLPDFT